ncbi:YciI family protein [Caulobacter mirabilis]|uniref:YCII-related domain-containing protein n=1 Tax=Caulobacter mirabilis TaxID=69666 RepID=A0A2D2AYC0_9CAUL|nr:YciI family protein [Caulobacter mirabilis]ATQ43004.1 hypothetical protein CSW64_11590 [Caulobacter mirabilis]
MAEFIFLMHGDGSGPEGAWDAYLADLQARGVLRGGSAIGPGETFRKAGAPGPLSAAIAGFIRVEVADLEAARTLLTGNPTYEAGGTVEIRTLPVTR